MGGMTALWLGIHRPERFIASRLPILLQKSGQQKVECTRCFRRSNGFEDLVSTTHTRWFSEKFDHQASMLAQNTIRSLANTPAQGYANACRALAGADLRESIAKISIPTLIIAGEADPVTTVSDAEFYINISKTAS